MALVVFDSIEPPAVQVKGLLNFFDSAGQPALLPLQAVQCVVRRGLQRVEVFDIMACLSYSPRDVRIHCHRPRQYPDAPGGGRAASRESPWAILLANS